MHLTRLTRRVGTAAAAAGLLLGAPLTINEIAHDRPAIGLRVAGSLDGAGRTDVWSDVDAAAQAATAHQAGTRLTVEAGAWHQSLTWAELGLVDTADELRDALLTVGRQGSFWSDALAQTRAAWGLEVVALPPARLDPDTLAAAVGTLADSIDVDTRDAAITTTDGVVAITAESNGVHLDRDTAQEVLADAVRRGTPSVELPTVSVPAAVTAADLAPVATTLRAAADLPLTLTAGDASVVVPPEHVLAALPVVTTTGEPVIEVDAARLAPDIVELADAVDRDPQPRVVMSGTVIEPGSDGRLLDQDAAAAAVTAELTARAAGQGSKQLTLTVTTVPAPVDEAAPGAFTDERTVHLTFDDGPGAHTEAILDILRDTGVHATFYVVGDRARQHPDTLRRILAEGHRLGNHSLTHADLTTLTAEEVAHELATTQDIIQEATGVRPTAFRPPFGAVDDTVRAAAAAQNLTIDLWSVDPQDWRSPGADVVRDRVLAAARPGSVVLLHVLEQGTVDALPQIIDGLRTRGLTLD